MGNQSIIDDGDLRKYRTEIPNMADDDLDPFQYRLYAHYKRVCGANGGECYESVRTTAEKTKMSNEKVISTRQWLADNGWIALDQRAKGTFSITIIDRWPENFTRYSERKTVRNSEQPAARPLEIPNSLHENNTPPLEIPNSTVRNSEQSPLEISNQRKNYIKKEPIKEDDHLPGKLLRSMVEGAGFMYFDRNFMEVACKMEADYSHEQLVRALQATRDAHQKKVDSGERGITAPLAYMKSVLLGDANSNGTIAKGKQAAAYSSPLKRMQIFTMEAQNE